MLYRRRRRLQVREKKKKYFRYTESGKTSTAEVAAAEAQEQRQKTAAERQAEAAVEQAQRVLKDAEAAADKKVADARTAPLDQAKLPQLGTAFNPFPAPLASATASDYAQLPDLYFHDLIEDAGWGQAGRPILSDYWAPDLRSIPEAAAGFIPQAQSSITHTNAGYGILSTVASPTWISGLADAPPGAGYIGSYTPWHGNSASGVEGGLDEHRTEDRRRESEDNLRAGLSRQYGSVSSLLELHAPGTPRTSATLTAGTAPPQWIDIGPPERKPAEPAPAAAGPATTPTDSGTLPSSAGSAEIPAALAPENTAAPPDDGSVEGWSRWNPLNWGRMFGNFVSGLQATAESAMQPYDTSSRRGEDFDALADVENRLDRAAQTGGPVRSGSRLDSAAAETARRVGNDGELALAVGEGVARTAVEPLDTVLSVKEIAEDPSSPANWLGLIPGIPGIGKGLSKLDNVRTGRKLARAANSAEAATDVGRAADGVAPKSGAFGSRSRSRAPIGEAEVRLGESGTTWLGDPVYSKYDNWILRKIPGLRRVDFPNANYGVRKGLPNEVAVRAHELAHMDFIDRYPQLAHLAGRGGYFPVKGIARTIIEFHGNMAQHNGNVARALLGTLKDTDWIAVGADSLTALTAWVLFRLSSKSGEEE